MSDSAFYYDQIAKCQKTIADARAKLDEISQQQQAASMSSDPGLTGFGGRRRRHTKRHAKRQTRRRRVTRKH